jgi:imidazolonepropionase-like amidohydrolase
MKHLITLLLICTSSVLFALSPQPVGPQDKPVVYNNATIHLGNGEVLENATIAFDKGKITRLGHFRMAWQKGDIDLKGKHVYPGFILPVTGLGLVEVGSIKATIDVEETGQNNANVRSIVAYNTDSEVTPTLRFNGVLLAQPTPKGGLISGLSSIVQLDAWNWEDAAVVLDDGLHINWPLVNRAKFDFSTFTLKQEKNKNFSKQLDTIKSLFADAKAGLSKARDHENLKLKAVMPVFNGSRRVYVHTNNAKAIIESITYLQSMGVKNTVLVTGQGVEPVIGFVKESGVPVIITSVHSLPQREDSSVDDGYNSAVKLNNAGILVGITYSGSMNIMGAKNLAFNAGTLVNYGMEKEQALKLITSNNAKILGIDKDYGTLEVGKSATLFISDGDALDMRSNKLEAAYIDGRKIKLDGRQQALNQRFLDKYDLK